MATYKGECFCGAVQIEVTGEPAGMGYCHCQSCRSWSGGPVNAFSLWNPDAVKVTAGGEHIGMYQKTPVSERQYCKKCGGHVMANHPPLGLIDVYAATIPTLKFTPGMPRRRSIARLSPVQRIGRRASRNRSAAIPFGGRNG